MRRILRTLRKAMLRPLRWRQEAAFSRALAKVAPAGRVVFIDIDNTIADTWPTLVPGRHLGTEAQRLANLAPLRGTLAFLRAEHSDAELWVFLSFRPIQHWRLTKRWLEANDAWREGSVLCLVDEVEGKLAYLARARGIAARVTLIDDLSHHHEHGEVRYYDDVIARVRALGVEHVGYDKIREVNG